MLHVSPHISCPSGIVNTYQSPLLEQVHHVSSRMNLKSVSYSLMPLIDQPYAIFMPIFFTVFSVLISLVNTVSGSAFLSRRA